LTFGSGVISVIAAGKAEIVCPCETRMHGVRRIRAEQYKGNQEGCYACRLLILPD